MTAVTGTTIVDIVCRNAAADGDGEFLRLLHPGREDDVLSYSGLVAEASRWAAHYRGLGVDRQARVIVALPHSRDLYAAYLGALLGGWVPAMFSFPSPKFSEQAYFATVAQLVANSRAGVMVTYPELASKLRQSLPGFQVVTPDQLGDAADAPVAAAGHADATAFLQFSSGTTGLKKGVALSHRALLAQVEAYGQATAIGASDRIVSWLPLYHDMGLITAFFLPLLRKIPVVAMSPFDWVGRPALWLQAVSRHRGTLAWLPNFAYNFLASRVPDEELAGLDLSSLRGIVNCSETVRHDSHKAFVRRFEPYGFQRQALASSYAMAENTFAVTSAGFGTPPLVDMVDAQRLECEGLAVPAEAEGGRALVSSGVPIADTTVAILDAAGNPLAERQVGEIAIASPSLMNGYDSGEDAGFRDGLFLTGDLGYLAQGHVFVTGRKKDLVVIGGRNVYPQDIEAVAGEVAGVLSGRVAAFGVADEVAGTERLILLVETEGAGGEEELRASLFAAVVEKADVAPAEIHLLPPRWLVKSTSGKISRNANRERYLRELAAPRPAPSASTPAPAPGDAIGRVRAAVAEVVGRVRPGTVVNDDTRLISSGLIDSFALVELMLALEARGVRLAPEQRRQTAAVDSIAAIAATLSSGAPAAAAETWSEDAPMRYDTPVKARATAGFWTWYYRLLFKLKGIACGPGLKVLGPILLQLDGDPARISLGTNVTLMPGVHLKNRERGSIRIGDRCTLDSFVRLVSANDATLELGENTALGMGTIINAGVDVRLARGCLVSSHCMINASDHGMAAGVAIRDQSYEHAPILLCQDVFVGAHCFIGKGSRIGAGAVISAGALVSGDVPANAIVHGRPARITKYRT